MADDRALLLQAEAYSDAGNHQLALATVGSFLTLHPDHVGGLTLAGGQLNWLGRPAEALRFLEQAALLAPDDCDVLTTLAISRRKLGDWEGSLTASRRTIELAPTNPLVYENCSDNLRLVWLGARQDEDRRLGRRELAGLLDEAMNYADQACQLAPDHPDAHTCRGLALSGLGRQQEAREEFQTALRLDPEDVNAQAGLASLHEKAGRHIQAGEGFFRLLRENPANLVARTNFLIVMRAYFAYYLEMALAASCLLALFSICHQSLGWAPPLTDTLLVLAAAVDLFSLSRFIRFRKQFALINHGPRKLTTPLILSLLAFVSSAGAGLLSVTGPAGLPVSALVLVTIALSAISLVSIMRHSVAPPG